GSMFYDVHKQEWSEELCSLVSLDVSMLPSVVESTDQSGTLTPEMAKKLELSENVAIITGTADTAAEIYGSGVTNAGDRAIQLATAGNFTILSKGRHNTCTLTIYKFPIPDLYYQITI